MKQKTAMQELIEFIEPELKMHDFLQLPAYEKALSLLEKEKQQILSANNAGWKVCNRRYNQNAEDYYKETFGNSNQAGI
jgi:hypothetical protein